MPSGLSKRFGKRRRSQVTQDHGAVFSALDREPFGFVEEVGGNDHAKGSPTMKDVECVGTPRHLLASGVDRARRISATIAAPM